MKAQSIGVMSSATARFYGESLLFCSFLYIGLKGNDHTLHDQIDSAVGNQAMVKCLGD